MPLPCSLGSDTWASLYHRQQGFGFPFFHQPKPPSSRLSSKLFQSLCPNPSYSIPPLSSAIPPCLKASLPSPVPAGFQWMRCYLLPAASWFSCNWRQMEKCTQLSSERTEPQNSLRSEMGGVGGLEKVDDNGQLFLASCTNGYAKPWPHRPKKQP